MAMAWPEKLPCIIFYMEAHQLKAELDKESIDPDVEVHLISVIVTSLLVLTHYVCISHLVFYSRAKYFKRV